MEPPGLLRHPQRLASCPNPKDITQTHVSQFHFLKILFNSMFPYKPTSSKWSHCLRFFLTKAGIYLYCPQYMPHDLPISFFLIWSWVIIIISCYSLWNTGRQQNVAIWSYLWPSPPPRSSTSLLIMSTDHEFIESVVCSQVEVSATGRSFVQRSPTDCDV